MKATITVQIEADVTQISELEAMLSSLGSTTATATAPKTGAGQAGVEAKKKAAAARAAAARKKKAEAAKAATDVESFGGPDAPSLDDLKAATRACMKEHGIDKTKEILGEFGLAQLVDATGEQYPDLLARLIEGPLQDDSDIQF